MKVTRTFVWLCMVVVAGGCTVEFSNPKWNAEDVDRDGGWELAPYRWTKKDTRKGPRNNCAITDFEGARKGVTLELQVTRYDKVGDSEGYYAVQTERLTRGDVPLHAKGTVGALAYAVSKSWMPRSDPEGGGGYHDRRITYLALRKNVTVATAVVYSEGAKKQVDLTEVVNEIIRLVGEW